MGAPLPIQLANLGMADTLILMVLALVVFGPRRLPQIGRQIGKLMYEFRKASNDFKFQMEEELRLSEEADRRKKEEAERAARAAALPPPSQTIEAGVGTAVAVEQASVSAQPAVTEPLPLTEQLAATEPPLIAEPPTVIDQPAALASPYAGESTYPTQYPPETPAELEHHLTLPRTVPVIQPPSSGQQVQAARPGTAVPVTPDAVTPEPVTPEPAAGNGPGHASPQAPPQDPTRSETISQHG